MTVVAITGINSYFAGTVLPLLEADPEVSRIIGIDIAPWKRNDGKVDFFQQDVRGPEIRDILREADTVMHLAFIVQEIHDKKKTHDINIQGSKNVFQACAAAGLRKIIYTSSIASYGAHPDNVIGMTEDFRLKANEDSYYSSDKVAVERYLEGFAREHPDILLTIFRPPVIVGPNLTNFGADMFGRKRMMTIKGKDSEVQFLHEEDLGQALYLAVKQDVPGIFNIAADDWVKSRRLYESAGIRLVAVPAGLLKVLANVTFALRLEKASQGWVSLMEHPVVISNRKFKEATGWQPRYSTEEAFLDCLKAIG